jgi:hypothetical protein
MNDARLFPREPGPLGAAAALAAGLALAMPAMTAARRQQRAPGSGDVAAYCAITASDRGRHHRAERDTSPPLTAELNPDRMQTPGRPA